MGSLVVNGVDVVPLVEAELDRRLPGRALRTAQTPEERADPWGDGAWRPSVGDCVRVVLDEEWAHLRYVRRDLALLG